MIAFILNGEHKEVDVGSDTPLLWILREHLKLTGTKFGCGIAACGACAVQLDGEPVRACATIADQGRCLERVAELADWGTKRNTTALGIAFAEKDETLMAGIAEIALDRGRGLIKVVNFWVVMDCGLSVQPRHLIAEVEGSIIYDLGHVLREEITIKGGHVQQSNFTDYEPLRMEETPEIKVEVIASDNPPIGGGEGVGPVTAASVGNAFFALTGVRLRDLPMSPARVKAALQGPS